jgi:hypothetical protein
MIEAPQVEQTRIGRDTEASARALSLVSYVPGFRTGAWWKALIAIGIYGAFAGAMLSTLGLASTDHQRRASTTAVLLAGLLVIVLAAEFATFGKQISFYLRFGRTPDAHDLEMGGEFEEASAIRGRREQEHRGAIKARESSLKDATRAIDRAEAEHKKMITAITKQLDGWRNPGCGKRLGNLGKLTLYEHRVVTPSGEASVVEAEVSIEPGRSKDAEVIFITLKAPSLVSVITCTPEQGEAARKFAALVHNAAAAEVKWQEARPGAIAHLEQQLTEETDDTAEIEAARARLHTVEEDPELLAAIDRTGEAAAEARQAVEAIEQRIRERSASVPAPLSDVRDDNRSASLPRRSVPAPFAWLLGAATFIIAFAVSVAFYPALVIIIVLVALILVVNPGGRGERLVRNPVWKGFPFVGRLAPAVSALALVAWGGATGAVGYGTDRAEQAHRAHIVALHITATASARQTVTAVAVARHTAFAATAIAAKTQAAATAVSKITAVAEASATAARAAVKQGTAVALMQRTAAPTETAAALVARFGPSGKHVRATLQMPSQQQVDLQFTATLVIHNVGPAIPSLVLDLSGGLDHWVLYGLKRDGGSTQQLTGSAYNLGLLRPNGSRRIVLTLTPKSQNVGDGMGHHFDVRLYTGIRNVGRPADKIGSVTKVVDINTTAVGQQPSGSDSSGGSSPSSGDTSLVSNVVSGAIMLAESDDASDPGLCRGDAQDAHDLLAQANQIGAPEQVVLDLGTLYDIYDNCARGAGANGDIAVEGAIQALQRDANNLGG